jgi:prepilin-type processing-associated H-X9-DG protein
VWGINGGDDTGNAFNYSNEGCGFRSRHTGGAHFALADGSVRFISENIDIRTFNFAGTSHGNDIAGEF